MKAPPEVIFSLAIIVRQHPEVLTYMRDWRDRELKSLPYAAANPTLFQGRCQVLHELVTLIEQAPSQSSTHTG